MIKAIITELANYTKETDGKAAARSKHHAAETTGRESETGTLAESSEPPPPCDDDNQAAESDPSTRRNTSDDARNSTSSDSTDRPSPPVIQKKPSTVIPTNEQLDMVAPPNTTVGGASYVDVASDSPSSDTDGSSLQTTFCNSQDSAISCQDFPPPNKVAPAAARSSHASNPSSSQQYVTPAPCPSPAFEQLFTTAGSHTGLAPASGNNATTIPQQETINRASACAGSSNVIYHIVYHNTRFNAGNPSAGPSNIYPFPIVADAPHPLPSNSGSAPHTNQLQYPAFNITSYPNPHFDNPNYPSAN